MRGPRFEVQGSRFEARGSRCGVRGGATAPPLGWVEECLQTPRRIVGVDRCNGSAVDFRPNQHGVGNRPAG